MMMVMKSTLMLVEPVHLYWIETSAWPEHNPLGSQPEASIMHGFVKALSCLTLSAMVATTEMLLPLQWILIWKK